LGDVNFPTLTNIIIQNNWSVA